MLCLDGEKVMDTKAIESYVENFINDNSSGAFPILAGDSDAINQFLYNTARRLTIYFEKFMSGRASKDVFLCSLRNYLLVFQNEMAVPDGLIPPENEYGIMRNAEGKYYANLELPDYIDSFFVDQAFQRKKVGGDTEKQKDIFYGNNAYIYNLTRYKEFKSLEQKMAVFGALNTPEGYTTLVSLPTGGGKSLITQTMAYQQEGLTIVIVPTVSLAIDQVRNAKNNVKHNADNEIFCYYSGIELERKNALRNAIKSETARLLFISPEALIRNTEFVSMINETNAKKYLKNLIVDEAHIVIEWGDFFRVDYQCLEPWRNELLAINAQLRTVLLSATYTKTAVIKLKQMFASANKWIEVRCDALRREPRYLLVKAKSYSDKKDVVKSMGNMRRYINTHLELVSDSLFYKVTQGYLDMGTEVLDHNSVSKMSDLMGRNIGEKVIEDDMRAWRFWMAFLGFGYMHDSQAGAAGILLPNTAVFLRDIIESLKLKKKAEYRIDEFVDLVMPYARIALHNAVDTKTFNYGFSNAIRMLNDLDVIKAEHRLDAQAKGNHSDITGNSAVASVMTREALVACDFSGDVLEGVDRQEEFKQEAFTLRTMRLDYELFNQQLGILGEEECEVFQQFIRGEKDLQTIAEDKGIVYESAQQRIHRAKRKIKVQMVGFLDGNIGGM